MKENLSLSKINEILNAQGLRLPEAPKPVASYIPYRISNNLIYTSGALPMENGKLRFTGFCGEELDIEMGKDAAKLALLNGLAVLHSALEELKPDSGFRSLNRIIQMTGFIQSKHDFHDQHLVLNGASQLLFDLFSDVGIHSRIAVGCSALPLNAPIEIALIAQFE